MALVCRHIAHVSTYRSHVDNNVTTQNVWFFRRDF